MTRPRTRRGRMLTAFRDRSRPAGGVVTPAEGLELMWVDTIRQLASISRIGTRATDGTERRAWGMRNYVASALEEMMEADWSAGTTAHLEEAMLRLTDTGAEEED